MSSVLILSQDNQKIKQELIEKFESKSCFNYEVYTESPDKIQYPILVDYILTDNDYSVIEVFISFKPNIKIINIKEMDLILKE